MYRDKQNAVNKPHCTVPDVRIRVISCSISSRQTSRPVSLTGLSGSGSVNITTFEVRSNPPAASGDPTAADHPFCSPETEHWQGKDTGFNLAVSRPLSIPRSHFSGLTFLFTISLFPVSQPPLGKLWTEQRYRRQNVFRNHKSECREAGDSQ